MSVPALAHRPEVVEFLLTRRSRPAKTLGAPGPDRAAIATILEAAARSPDHGKLVPWRFVVIEGAAQGRVAEAAHARAMARGLEAAEADKAARAFTQGTSIIAVVFSPKASEKIPVSEQWLSAGGVCLAALNAALALGWGANWLTGWPATDAPFLQEALGCAAGEAVAGFIHLGAETVVPAERPRPDIETITTWL